ncbi:unnamed protein product [Phaedon cochleariae]|uniref:Ell-associated factor Eaf n=1 Tax=Phaedon cochleariae TaxID=80249 RepID=A0A9P0GQD2_PHACE|nr:unnamed protein product [Phaedon cochleariae]
MAEKLGLGNEIRELKIGQSFTNPKSKAFHTLKYDFKPASVDTSKKANVEVPGVNQVTVTVPHLDGAGIPQTVFKGSQKPYTKECVLIIDRVTGEITLEKLSCNIQVKKTRSEYNKPNVSKGDRTSQSEGRPPGSAKSSPPLRQPQPQQRENAVGHRVSHKTRVASGSRRADRHITHLVPKHSPLHASPTSNCSPAQAQHNSLPPPSNNELHNQSTLASLPMIGMDDFSDMRPSSRNAHPPNSHSSRSTSQLPTQQKRPTPPSLPPPKIDNNGVGEITDSSSSSSSSDSESDGEATLTNKSLPSAKMNGYSNGNSGPVKIDTGVLNDDLCLSESGSDSD